MSENNARSDTPLVLVADDDPAIRILARASLERIGFSIVEAEDGERALALIRSMQPGVVLLDVVMPKGDGFSVCRELRGIPEHEHTPVLMMTGLDDNDSINRAYDVGATDFITKPINWVILGHRLRYMWRASRMNRKLVESEEKYRALVETTGTGYVILDETGCVLDANREYVRLTGHVALGEILGRNVAEWTAPNGFGDGVEEGGKRLQQGHACNFEVLYRNAEKTFIPIEINSTALPTSEGVRIICLCRDITERKRAEEALRESERRFRTLLQYVPTVAVQGYAADGAVSYWNEASVKLYGYTCEEALGKNLLELIIPPFMRSEARKVIRRMVDTGRPEPAAELQLMRKDGSLVPVFSSHAVVQIPGRSPELYCLDMDLTEIKHTEEELRRARDGLEKKVEERTTELIEANKMLTESQKQLRELSARVLSTQEEERTRIAGELHDSIGSLLSAIKFGVENAVQRADDPDAPVCSALKEVIPLVQQCIQETQRMYMDLRPSILDDLGIVSTINWFSRKFEAMCFGMRVEMKVGIQEDEIPDRLKIIIFRVIQESLNNAAKHSSADRVLLSLVKTEEEKIELMIADNGNGFDSRCSSCGLGLVSMQERVDSSGGIFSITSMKDAGTTVRALWDADKPAPGDASSS